MRATSACTDAAPLSTVAEAKYACGDAPNVSGGGGGTAFDAERICANTVMPVPAMPVCAAAASSASRGSTPPDETRMRSYRVFH